MVVDRLIFVYDHIESFYNTVSVLSDRAIAFRF